jgi:hypothetical protein
MATLQTALDLAAIFTLVVVSIYAILIMGHALSVGVWRFLSRWRDNAKGRFLIDLFVITALAGYVLGTITGWLR